ncbi:uncharacterized protein LOC107606346 isoform X2 [Arachis ipaensis]|uniref:uncharacterized protein LOC107606346 isoform X2 n=1 Tax=Arachis ipaensis TaxID=130454 RepID=UPI000A2B07D7|nr:uncharacterized protein LOC107606346 isoform X2 [Arachis ipaensis]
MLLDGGETPSRHELLSMVKKHSNLIGKTVVEEQEDASDVEMDMKFWHDVFDLYFVRGKESRGRQDDDLVFFVRKLASRGSGSNNNADNLDPYFVRSYQVLQNHQSGQDTPLSPVYKVVKTVYASPSRVNFQLDSKKEVETTPAYPDICFAIDDFDSTFDTVVLTEKDHCYCVVLNAHDGAAFPSEKGSNDCSTSDNSSPNSSSAKKKDTKLTLFSGFVSYQMVRDAYDAGKSRFGSLLSVGHYTGKTDRIYMKGPGGRGEVEVAVSGVTDQSQQDSGPSSPVISKNGLGLGVIFRRAASVATVAARHAYAAASSSGSDFDEMIPLKCSLMSISLPWEYIAYDLLFKGAPPVNM